MDKLEPGLPNQSPQEPETDQKPAKSPKQSSFMSFLAHKHFLSGFSFLLLFAAIGIAGAASYYAGWVSQQEEINNLEAGVSALQAELKSEHQWGRLAAAIVLDEMDEQARPAIPALKQALVRQPNKYIVRVANRALNELQGTNNAVP